MKKSLRKDRARRQYNSSMRARGLPLAVLVLLAAGFLSGPSGSPSEPVYGAEEIPGSYIVVFEDGVDGSAGTDLLELSAGVSADAVFTNAIEGFAADMSTEQVERLAASDLVAAIVPDRRVSIGLHQNPFQTLPTGVDRVDAESNPIAAIDNSGPNLNIDVAVIDTGITPGHLDLNFGGGPSLPCAGNTYVDGHGHGTHVSGTVAAIDNNLGVVGVAPGARVWAVKVLDNAGNGTTSCVISGVDWVTGRRLEYNDGPGDGDPGVNIQAANLSLGGNAEGPPQDDPLCQAIGSAVAAGVMIIVAAGNAASDSATESPAHCPTAVTVSAFGDFDGQPGALSANTLGGFSSCQPNEVITDDTFACFSNYGSLVDIAAPGVDIVSTYPGPGGSCSVTSCYAWMSGTSMAAPHVTGALLLLRLSGYGGLSDSASAMSALHAAGYTRSQNSACGFTGDQPGDPSEPVLYMGTGCPDSDHDSFPNTIDNCPSVANISQSNQDGDPYGDACEQVQCVTIPNFWTVPSGDSDCDGYPDAVAAPPRAPESFIGTQAGVKCAGTPNSNDEPLPDAWPPDFNDNQFVNGADWLTFNTHLGHQTGDAAYDERWDLNASGLINGADLLQMNPFFSKSCD